MSEIVFARTGTEYTSYTDFWRLVELSGFPIVSVGEIDPDDGRTYIVTPVNGEWQHGWRNPRAKIILWMLEWSLDQYPITVPHGVHEVWCSDAWQAHNINAKYVPMGSHPGLKDANGTAEPTYDVAFLGYIIPRRQQIMTELDALGVTRSPTSAWGTERHDILLRSRAYLHVHQWGHVPGIPALRMVVAAAYSLPVITERVEDAGLFDYRYLLTSDFMHLSAFTKMWTKDAHSHRKLADFGASLHNLLCWQMPFRKSVEDNL